MSAEFKETDKGISLFINGEEITSYHLEEDFDSLGNKFSMHVCANDFELDTEEINELLKLSNSDIPRFFDFYKQRYLTIQNASLNIFIDNHHVGLSVEHNLETWTNPFKYTDFVACYSKLLTSAPFKSRDELTLTIGFDETFEEPMLPEVNEAIEWLNKCYLEAENIMHDSVKSEVFTKLFDFPPEYRNICSQYLVWFGEFLKNLGIEANVSTKNSGTQTALIVTPDNCPELLENIEKLFYQYIELPYVELLPPQGNLTPQEIYAYQSAVMQVQHLQTQIQMKDSVIASYEATNTNLVAQIKEQSSKLLLIDSLKEDNKISLFGGLIEINQKLKIGKNNNATIDLSKLPNIFKKK